MSRLLISVVMLAVVLAGCDGGDPGEQSDPLPAPTATSAANAPSSPAPVHSDEATEALNRGIRKLVRSSHVGFSHSITAQGTLIFTTEGVWVPQRRWVSTTTSDDPDSGESYVMHAVSVGRQTWMQMENWTGDDAGCWLATSGTQVPLGISGLTPGVPGYFSVLPYLRPRGFEPDDPSVVVAEVRLDYAAILFPVRVAQLIQDEVERPGQARVEVRVSVGRNGVEGYGITGANLVDAIAKATSEEASGLVQAVIGTTTFRVRSQATLRIRELFRLHLRS